MWSGIAERRNQPRPKPSANKQLSDCHALHAGTENFSSDFPSSAVLIVQLLSGNRQREERGGRREEEEEAKTEQSAHSSSQICLARQDKSKSETVRTKVTTAVAWLHFRCILLHSFLSCACTRQQNKVKKAPPQPRLHAPTGALMVPFLSSPSCRSDEIFALCFCLTRRPTRQPTRVRSDWLQPWAGCMGWSHGHCRHCRHRAPTGIAAMTLEISMSASSVDKNPHPAKRQVTLLPLGSLDLNSITC